MAVRTRTSTLTATAAALAMTCAAVVGIAGPAAADTRTFRDAKGDTDSRSDVTRVVVRHGAASGKRLVVAARVGDLHIGDRALLYVDTRPANRGPEYRMFVLPNSDSIDLRRVPNFRRDGRSVDCRGLEARADAFAADAVRFSIPRRCLHTPPRVRVAVKMHFPSGSGSVVDWAPARRQFFGRVHR